MDVVEASYLVSRFPTSRYAWTNATRQVALCPCVFHHEILMRVKENVQGIAHSWRWDTTYSVVRFSVCLAFSGTFSFLRSFLGLQLYAPHPADLARCSANTSYGSGNCGPRLEFRRNRGTGTITNLARADCIEGKAQIESIA
jgi:hypothetical protein